MAHTNYKGRSGSYRWQNKVTKEIVEITTHDIGRSIKHDIKLGFSLDTHSLSVNAYPIPEEVKFERDKVSTIEHKYFYKFSNKTKSVLISTTPLHGTNINECVSDDYDTLVKEVKRKYDYDIKY